jgi:hypothetical protein
VGGAEALLFCLVEPLTPVQHPPCMAESVAKAFPFATAPSSGPRNDAGHAPKGPSPSAFLRFRYDLLAASIAALKLSVAAKARNTFTVQNGQDGGQWPTSVRSACISQTPPRRRDRRGAPKKSGSGQIDDRQRQPPPGSSTPPTARLNAIRAHRATLDRLDLDGPPL